MRGKVIAVLAIVGLLAFAQTLSAQEKKKRGGPRGTVKSIDTSKNQIVVAVREGKGKDAKDTTFKLAKEVKVTIGDEAKTLADVKEGANVTLTVKDDEVTEIRVFMRKKKDNT